MMVGGDKVLILAKFVPGTPRAVPPGTKATVINVDGDGASVDYYDNGRLERWWFYKEDLQLPYHPLLEPTMELDEIERAEKLMEGLK